MAPGAFAAFVSRYFSKRIRRNTGQKPDVAIVIQAPTVSGVQTEKNVSNESKHSEDDDDDTKEARTAGDRISEGSKNSSNPPEPLNVDDQKDDDVARVIAEHLSSASTSSSHTSVNVSATDQIRTTFNVLDILDKKLNKGVIFLVKRRSALDPNKTVLKVVSKNDDKALYRRKREMHNHLMSSESSHPHIAAFIAKHDFPSCFGIEMEYCQGGDLTKLRASASLAERLDIVRQVASALRYLHEVLALIHIDLKPENVGLSSLSNGHVIAKLIDFESAKPIGKLRDVGKPFGGTWHFSAPETFAGGSTEDENTQDGAKLSKGNGKFVVGPPLDIWGLGVILLHLITKQLPWLRAVKADSKYSEFSELVKMRESGSSEIIPIDGVSEYLPSVCYRHLIPGMLHPAPAQRYSAMKLETILNMHLQTQNGRFRDVDGVRVFQSYPKSRQKLFKMFSPAK